jgi:hypothetical protein
MLDHHEIVAGCHCLGEENFLTVGRNTQTQADATMG